MPVTEYPALKKAWGIRVEAAGASRGAPQASAHAAAVRGRARASLVRDRVRVRVRVRIEELGDRVRG